MDSRPPQFRGAGAREAGGDRVASKITALTFSVPACNALISILAAGYALLLVVRDAREGVGIPSESAGQHTGVMALLARSRRFWLPAFHALALIVVLMITLTQQVGAGQRMYDF